MSTKYPTIDLNAFLRLYLDPANTAATIADALRLTIQQLVDFLAAPHVMRACEALNAFHRARLPILSHATIENILREIKSLPTLTDPSNHAQIDRSRKTLDSLRRALETLFKFNPSPNASVKHASPPSFHSSTISSAHQPPASLSPLLREDPPARRSPAQQLAHAAAALASGLTTIQPSPLSLKPSLAAVS